MQRFWRAATRIVFVALFVLPAAYCSFEVSPLKLGTLQATVHDAKVWQVGRSTYSLNPAGEYQIIFTTKEVSCAFRYPFYIDFHDYWFGPADDALSEGEKIEIVYWRNSLAPASRAAGVDCLSGARLPGRSPFTVPSRSMLPDLIEAMDVWKGGWTVVRWLPQRYQWIIFSTLGFAVGLIILFAPLIDRYSGAGRRLRRRRLGMRALSAFDEEARKRRDGSD